MIMVEYANAYGIDVAAPLHDAARKGLTAVVKVLVVEYCVDANAINDEGEMPLHNAAREGHIKW